MSNTYSSIALHFKNIFFFILQFNNQRHQAHFVQMNTEDSSIYGGPLFMDLFYLSGARYQLGHCPVSCSSCNIDFIYIAFILFYFILLIYSSYTGGIPQRWHIS